MAFDHNPPWKRALTLLCGAAISSLSPALAPPTEIERLQFYIGDWAYAATYDKSTLFPTGGRNAGWWTSQWGPRRLSVVISFEAKGTIDSGAGMEIMRWDPKQRVYRDHAIWYDEPGQWEFVGRFEGATLVYRGEFDVDGHRVKFRSETRPSDAGGCAMTEYASVDGRTEERVLQATATRRK